MLESRTRRAMWIPPRLAVALVAVAILAYPLGARAAEHSPGAPAGPDHPPVRKRINFLATQEARTANPPGWEAYDGSPYTRQRGYGWLTDLRASAWDSGGAHVMILPDGTRASPRDLGRLELANGHASHTGNRPVVLRVDLPDGWYRVTCTSVNASDRPLPLVDERTIKLRAHDVVFAGSRYGPPLKIVGNRLIEGSGIVEVTDGHLRIVMGDPAYAGWTWAYRGPFWAGWRSWWHPSAFASGWYQKITRTVDPGFHGLRINSLDVERVAPPPKVAARLFQDYFNREDGPDINAGVADANRWRAVGIHPGRSASSAIELYRTSLALTGPRTGRAVVGLVQRDISPAAGLIRYATRVSLFTGEGSKVHSGAQEAGLVILGAPNGVSDFNATFLGIAFDRSRSDTPGWVRYRVGDGRTGYRTDHAIPDTALPFRIAEGEYEISVDHDVGNNVLRRIQINGEDITGRFSVSDRAQRVPRGVFGLRSSLDALGSGVDLRQFFWYYRVEDLSAPPTLAPRAALPPVRLSRPASD